MTPFSQYKDRFAWARMERDERGILTIHLHHEGGPFVFPLEGFSMQNLYIPLAGDPETKAIVLIGTGDSFCIKPTLDEVREGFRNISPAAMDYFAPNGIRSHDTAFELDIPVILAVNGPASIHLEMFLNADIMLAVPEATFQDGNHLIAGYGMATPQMYYEELMGAGRNRPFTLLGETLDAASAKEAGIVTDVVPRDRLLAEAQDWAARLAGLPAASRRALRRVLNAQVRERVFDEIRLNSALFEIGMVDQGSLLAGERTDTSDFARYQNAYPNLTLSRDANGVVTMTLHTDNEPLIVTEAVEWQLANVWRDLAADRGNRLLLIRGTAGAFCSGAARDEANPMGTTASIDRWMDRMNRRDEGILNLPLPIVAVVEGACHALTELVFCCDIVIAAENTTFRDPSAASGMAVGGLAQVVWQEMLGPLRANPFLLFGETLTAEEAKRAGAIYNVVPADKLTAQANEIVERLTNLTTPILRYARRGLVMRMAERVRREAPYGYAMAAVAALAGAAETKGK